ncbi:MAG: threonine synthase [Ignavibacteriaceae bacterium]|nr:threonine synthase [Ignavibacteriaceae bacterium]
MHYSYQCFSCKSEFSKLHIENEQHYLCPNCGKAEKSKPLNGVLQFFYDYESIRKTISKKNFLEFNPGKFWLYPQLWPLDYSCRRNFAFISKVSQSQLENIQATSSPIIQVSYKKNNLLIFDDTRNPTLSYKDRASALVALKAIQLGIKEISAASTGNAGSSLAGICARLGIKSHIFVPEKIPLGKRIQIQSFGANIYLVKGDYDQAFDLCLEISKAKGWYNRNTAYNPLTIEGKKSAAFDMFISLKGKMPDCIFVPVGDGVIISGLYKGLWELKQLGWISKLPKLVAVQASGSDALVRYIKTKKFIYKPAQTIADSIHAGAPRNLFMAANAITKTNGYAISVTDSEIINAQKISAKEFGILIEPAAAASLAGYLKLVRANKISPREKSLLMFTGNGLKDQASLINWNDEPKSYSPTEWKQILKVK